MLQQLRPVHTQQKQRPLLTMEADCNIPNPRALQTVSPKDRSLEKHTLQESSKIRLLMDKLSAMFVIALVALFLSRVWLSILKGIRNTRVCSIWQYYNIKNCCIQVISPLPSVGDRFPSLCKLIYNLFYN